VKCLISIINTDEKTIYPSFVTRRMAGGGATVLPEIFGQLAPGL